MKTAVENLTVSLLIGAVLVAAPLLWPQEKGDVFVVGWRALFAMSVLAYSFSQSVEVPEVFEATVTFTDSRGRFAAAGHDCDCPPLGYGFLNLPQGKKKADRTEFDLSYRQAALFVNRGTDAGLFGWLQKPVPGLRAAVGEPEEGSAAVLINQKVGAQPKTIPVVLVRMAFPGEAGSEGWYVVTQDPVLLPGASGGPVVQVRDGKLYLVGAIRETIGSSLGLPGYIAEITPASKLAKEVSRP
jgi:hypothetical protein